MEIMTIIRHHFDTIGSTNTWAKEHAREFPKDQMILITADEQTAGRGRFKRHWLSPRGVNIYATYCFLPKPNFTEIGHIPQLLALVASQVLDQWGFKLALKWPNDLILSGKKLGGILCETVAEQDGRWIICGIGLNVNMRQEDLDKIDRPATSLFSETGSKYSKDEILEKLTTRFHEALEKLLDEGFESFYEEYSNRLCFKTGDPVKFHDNQTIVKGAFHTYNQEGSITLKLENGILKTYYAGEFV